MAEKGDSARELKMWAEAIANSERPSVRRAAMYQYLGVLWKLAAEASPSLKRTVDEMAPADENWIALVKPLGELQEVMRQADNREVPALFSDAFKSRILNRPRQPRERTMVWAYASAAVTVLVEEYGKPLSGALKLVARCLKKNGTNLPVTPHGKDDMSNYLKNWRHKCMSGGKGRLARKYYDEALAFSMYGKYQLGCGVSKLYKEKEFLDFLLSPPLVPHDPVDVTTR